MARIITDGLTAMQRGRLDKALDAQIRHNGTLTTWRALVATLPGAKRESDNMAAYNRVRFNRMNEREQAAYIARLESKRIYMLDAPCPKWGTVSLEVPKIIFDAVAPDADDETGPEYLTDAEAAHLFGEA